MKLFKKWKRPNIPIRAWIQDHREGLIRFGKISVGVGVLSLVVLLIHREVYSLVVGREEYRVNPDSFRLSLAPKWAQGMNAVSIDLGPDGTGAEWNIFDTAAVARVGKAFEKNPWVQRVTVVERIFPNQLRVKFEYRTPYATVRTSEGWVAIDRDRVRLPGLWQERPPRMLDADLVGLPEAPEPGQTWSDPSLEAGLELAELVEQESVLAKVGVQVIDVSNIGGRVDAKKSELALLTANGCVIYWGRPSTTNKFGELTPSQKVDNLKMVLQTYPHLDGLRYVKVYSKEPTVLENDSRTSRRDR
jgi:hypothetical protein